MSCSKKEEGRLRRKLSIRKKVVGSTKRPRLTVFRSARHIYAQVIDDSSGQTLVAASTLSKDLRGQIEGNKTSAAIKVGSLVAEMCKSRDITMVSFDRNGYRYHGRIKALADAARKAGLEL